MWLHEITDGISLSNNINSYNKNAFLKSRISLFFIGNTKWGSLIQYSRNAIEYPVSLKANASYGKRWDDEIINKL